MKSTTIIALAALAATASCQCPAPEALYSRPLPSCPGELTGTILLPDLTVPVSQLNPNASYGDSSDVVVFTPNDFGTVINFNIPPEAENMTCTLYFSFPNITEQGYDVPPPYFFEGPGNFDFLDFMTAPGPNVTWNSFPATYADLGSVQLLPGNFYALSTIPCPVGEISTVVYSNDSTLVYQESVTGDRCPMGLFTTYE